MPNKEIINFANHLADISGEMIKKFFRIDNGEITKEDDSPVTHGDREAEKVMREAIEKQFPDHGIIGEEFGIKEAQSDCTWVLDPIDGTSSFIIGRATFGTLIGLIYKGKVVFGIMNQPITGERWMGIEGDGTYFNGKKIHTRNCGKISNAVMCSSSSFYFKNEDEKILKKITKLTKYQKLGGVIYGGDCYSYASLASGFVDIVIDPGMKIYDYAAMLPIVKNAGGVMTDWQGNDLGLKSGVQVLACATKELHAKVVEEINS